MCAKCLLTFFFLASGYVSGFLYIPLSDPDSGSRRQYRVTQYRETLERAHLVEMDPLLYIGHEIMSQAIY